MSKPNPTITIYRLRKGTGEIVPVEVIRERGVKFCKALRVKGELVSGPFVVSKFDVHDPVGNPHFRTSRDTSGDNEFRYDDFYFSTSRTALVKFAKSEAYSRIEGARKTAKRHAAEDRKEFREASRHYQRVLSTLAKAARA